MSAKFSGKPALLMNNMQLSCPTTGELPPVELPALLEGPSPSIEPPNSGELPRPPSPEGSGINAEGSTGEGTTGEGVSAPGADALPLRTSVSDRYKGSFQGPSMAYVQTNEVQMAVQH